MKYFVGAYASSPNVTDWDAELETAYYDQLKTLSNIKGLEHPFLGTLHPHDDDWFLANLDPKWDLVLTTIPGVMGELAKNVNFGLASDNEAGRQAALQFMQKACAAVKKVNTYANRQLVYAVQIQTAPNRSASSSSMTALEMSLRTMLAWDWHGAKIVIEHCDQFIEGQVPSKGFLSLEEEITVLIKLNSEREQALGIVINWGRSAIETRSQQGPIDHIKQVKDADLLAGVMFSGASDKDSEYGVWQDAHIPPQPSTSNTKGAPESLLTETEIHKCLTVAGGKDNLPSIIGVKIGIRPYQTSMEDRVAYNRDTLAMLDRFL